MRRNWSIWTVVSVGIVIAALLGGCASEEPETGPAPHAPVDAETGIESAQFPSPPLTGTSWVLMSMGEGQIPAMAEQQPTLGFLPDRYGGHSGRNFYVGVYNSEGSSLVMQTPASTGGVCIEPEEVQQQESVYKSSLATVTSYAVVDENLEMYSSSEQLMLTMQSMDAAPLLVTVWSLQFLNVNT